MFSKSRNFRENGPFSQDCCESAEENVRYPNIFAKTLVKALWISSQELQFNKNKTGFSIFTKLDEAASGWTESVRQTMLPWAYLRY